MAPSENLHEEILPIRMPRLIREDKRTEELSQNAVDTTSDSLTFNLEAETAHNYSYSYKQRESGFGNREAVAIELQPMLAPKLSKAVS